MVAPPGARIPVGTWSHPGALLHANLRQGGMRPSEVRRFGDDDGDASARDGEPRPFVEAAGGAAAAAADRERQLSAEPAGGASVADGGGPHLPEQRLPRELVDGALPAAAGNGPLQRRDEPSGGAVAAVGDGERQLPGELAGGALATVGDRAPHLREDPTGGAAVAAGRGELQLREQRPLCEPAGGAVLAQPRDKPAGAAPAAVAGARAPQRRDQPAERLRKAAVEH